MTRTREVLTLVVWLIISTPMAASTQECAEATCGVPPKYRVGHIWEDAPSSIMMNISMRKADFTPSRLICLAGALKQKYASRKHINILMFTDHRAAERYTAPFTGDSPLPRTNWALRKHADYIFDVDAGEDTIYIRHFDEPNAAHSGKVSADVDDRVKGEGPGGKCPKVVWQ